MSRLEPPANPMKPVPATPDANPIDPRDTDDKQGNCQYLPTQVFGNAGILSFAKTNAGF